MAREIIFKSKVKKAAGIALEAWETGLRSIAGEVKAQTQALIATPFPPASNPLQPPHSRRGSKGLQGDITVVVVKGTRGRAAAIAIKSGKVYAKYLEGGTRKMIKRPFAQVVLTGRSRRQGAPTLSKKWVTKITRAAKAKADNSARKTRTGKAR